MLIVVSWRWRVEWVLIVNLVWRNVVHRKKKKHEHIIWRYDLEWFSNRFNLFNGEIILFNDELDNDNIIELWWWNLSNFRPSQTDMITCKYQSTIQRILVIVKIKTYESGRLSVRKNRSNKAKLHPRIHRRARAAGENCSTTPVNMRK